MGLNSADKTATTEEMQQITEEGKCPWPFVLIHAPHEGFHDHPQKTMAAIGAIMIAMLAYLVVLTDFLEVE
jgi:hypothetical protein